MVYTIYSKVIKPCRSKLLEFEKKIVCTVRLIETFSKYLDQYDPFFLRWIWLFNSDFLEKIRPGHLVEQDA